MKAILIILFAGFGFLSLYALNPNYVDLPFVGGILFAGIGMGCCIGSIFKQSKTKKKLKASRLINKSILNDKAELINELNRVKQRCNELIEDKHKWTIINNQNNKTFCNKISELNIGKTRAEGKLFSLQGNFSQLQKKYELLKKERNELAEANASNIDELFNKLIENKHLKEAIAEQSKMMNAVLNEPSIPEFDSKDIESQLNNLNIR